MKPSGIQAAALSAMAVLFTHCNGFNVTGGLGLLILEELHKGTGFAGIMLTESGNSTNVTEGGAGDSYAVVLLKKPTADVRVTVTPDNQVSVNAMATPIILIFTPDNWSVEQTIAVAAVDDTAQESNHLGFITHSASSADAGYNGISGRAVTVNITDNDTPGVSVVESLGSTDVDETGTSDTYTVVLTKAPTAAVTITLTPLPPVTVNGSAAPIVLTFTAGVCPGVGNWCTPQTVTVAAADNSIAEGNRTVTITQTSTSADLGYNGLAVNSVVANISDNDIAGVSIVESAGSTAVSESGTTDSYDVVLTSEPTQNVTVQLAFDSAQLRANGAVSPVSLLFTPGTCPGVGNWCTAQTVNVTAVNDGIVETLVTTSPITHTTSSSDPNYSGIAVATVSTQVTDNDVPGVTITESSSSTGVLEGGAADTYTVVLNSDPSANVAVDVTPNNAEVTVNTLATTTLTFTPGACPGVGNWCTPQTVSVAVTNNGATDGNRTRTITHAATSADGGYNGISIAGVSVGVTDDDTPGVTITQTAGSTDVTEAGGTDTYTVVLNMVPTANVLITVTPGSQVRVNGSTSPIVLTFTNLDWSTPQSVTVGAVNDAVASGSIHNSTISHSSASGDPGYNGIGVAGITVHISDNEFVLFKTTTTALGGFGISGADALCNADAGRPFTSSTYKAVLTDGVVRRACSSFNCSSSGAGEHIGWVLKASTSYYRANGTTLIKATNANGIFNFNLTNSTTGTAASYWTGLKADWTTDGPNTCNSWTSNAANKNARSGRGNDATSNAINDVNIDCDQPTALLCAEQ